MNVVMNLWVLMKDLELSWQSDCQCTKNCALWTSLFVIPLQKFQIMCLRIILDSWSEIIKRLLFKVFVNFIFFNEISPYHSFLLLTSEQDLVILLSFILKMSVELCFVGKLYLTYILAYCLALKPSESLSVLS